MSSFKVMGILMRNFGLKVYSIDFIKNISFTKDAEKALKEGKFGYMELFALPDSFDKTWRNVENFKGIKTIIHAPHARFDLNPSEPDLFEENQHKLYDSQRFADMLDAEMIILHPGFGHDDAGFNENIRQFKAFNEPRLAVENLPLICSSTHRKLQGVTPDEIKRFIDEVGCKFCLDFSHAICGANSFKRDVYEVLDEFKALTPAMYHLCDGGMADIDDAHLHYGEGNYDLKRLVNDYTSDNALITMETGHGIPSSVQPWLDDLTYIQHLIA